MRMNNWISRERDAFCLDLLLLFLLHIQTSSAISKKKKTKQNKTINIKKLSNILVFGRVSAKRLYYYARDRKNI